jgi:putative sterol carrier protein
LHANNFSRKILPEIAPITADSETGSLGIAVKLFGFGGRVATFPTPEWLPALVEKLNNDPKYAQVARNWEGDMLVQIDPGGDLKDRVIYYLDLWHGKCRGAYPLEDQKTVKAAFILKAPYESYVRLLKGELEPMQALLTRKLGLNGNMAVLMRNVPTVLDFVRCCREVTDAFI